jgi:hypothetical protein
MAEKKHTASTPRRATAAKATKAPSAHGALDLIENALIDAEGTAAVMSAVLDISPSSSRMDGHLVTMDRRLTADMAALRKAFDRAHDMLLPNKFRAPGLSVVKGGAA